MEFEFREIDCPVCETADFRVVGYRGGDAHHSGNGVRTRIVRCLNCTHQYPNPMPFPASRLAELYTDTDEYFANHDFEAKKSGSLEQIKEIEKRLGRKGSILDIGSGRGELLWAARETGWESVGIEPSADFAEFGRTHLGVEPRAATLEEAGLTNGSFDVIVMNGLIEHLYDPAMALSDARRLLKPDGWLYFDAPNEDGLYMKLGNAYMRMRGRDWVVVLAPTFPPFHVQGFNPRSVNVLLERQDFVIREFGVYGMVCPQTGPLTFQKKLEFQVGKLANAIGNAIGRGSYMYAWAQRR